MEIYYKQDAINKLSEILRKNYYCKSVLVMISNGVKDKYLSLVANELNSAESPFKVNEERGEYDLVIAVGGGRVCNKAKLFAKERGIDLIVVPTAPTSPIYFNDECYIQDFNSLEIIKEAEAKYAFVDEKIIQTAPLYLAKRGFLFGLSINEILYEKEIYNLLFNKNENLEDLKYLLVTLEKGASKLASGERESKLEVMDFMIEIAKLKLDLSAIITLAHLLDLSDNFASENIIIRKYKKLSEQNKNLNLNYLIASDLLICCYKEMFSLKKIEPKILPDLQKLQKKLNNFDILMGKIKNLAFFDKIIENKELFLKINVIKHKCYYMAEIYKDKIKNCIKKLINISPEMPDINICFNAISVIPMFNNKNLLVNMLSCVGILDWCLKLKNSV